MPEFLAKIFATVMCSVIMLASATMIIVLFVSIFQAFTQ
jgi:flagellar biosynthesis protein FliQ